MARLPLAPCLLLGLVFFGCLCGSVAPSSAGEVPASSRRNPAQSAITGDSALDRADRLALSGSVEGVRTALFAYAQLSTETPPQSYYWRVSRAWFNLYDELPRPAANEQRKSAARSAERVAREGLARVPDDPETRYWLGMALLARADLENVFTFLGNVRTILSIMREVQKVRPDLDDGGPDRLLGIFLHELPWPWGDAKVAYEHIQKALDLAPYRCANHDLAARLFIERKEWDAAAVSVRQLSEGLCTASSPMWDEMYHQHGVELARELNEKRR